MPHVPFEKFKKNVLGKKYDLSLVFLSPSEAQRISVRTKHSQKAHNVLSFPLSKNSGEIFLCPGVARAQAKSYGTSVSEFLSYLFIHGMLHLKGYSHGDTMERHEQRLMKRFGIHIRL